MHKKNIILGIVLFFIVLSIILLEVFLVKPSLSSKDFDYTNYSLAPELIGASGFINANDSFSLASLKGKVILIDFWTYTCINCIRTIPHLVEWDKKYKNDGLVIIGIHTPEFLFEKKYDNVLAATQKYNISYPVVLDNDYAIWSSYANHYWPHKYLIDRNGYVRYHHIGEGGYDETEKQIQQLLLEVDSSLTFSSNNLIDMTPQTYNTQELYAGSLFMLSRGQNIGNSEGLQAGKIYDYTSLSSLPSDMISLDGTWKSTPQTLETFSDAALILPYRASNVYFVGFGNNVEVEVLLDNVFISKDAAGKDVLFDGDRAFIIVNEERLYDVVSSSYAKHTLELRAPKGFSVNAFTFG